MAQAGQSTETRANEKKRARTKPEPQSFSLSSAPLTDSLGVPVAIMNAEEQYLSCGDGGAAGEVIARRTAESAVAEEFANAYRAAATWPEAETPTDDRAMRLRARARADVQRDHETKEDRCLY